MSLRALRKLHGDKDFVNDDSDPEPELECAGGAKKKQLNINRYDVLSLHSHSESEVNEHNDHETEAANAPEEVDDAPESPSRQKKKKKKKKKKRKAEFNSWSSDRISEDNLKVEQDEESAVASEHAVVSPTVCIVPKRCMEARKPLLHVSHRNLNADTELKRKFGCRVVRNEQRKRRGHSHGHLKSSWLVSPAENWPPIGKLGLSMKLIGSTHNGCIYFKYDHSTNYRKIQKTFLEAVDSLDHNRILAIADEYPYHIDTLIQLSDICKMEDDLQTAAKLIEMALYCFECAFHPLFTIAKGHCRLDYRIQENRAFFIALFNHLTFVGQRACYRTALELCRLLLSLDPDEDPLAVILCIDFYALRSMKYEWLICAYEEWEPIRNVSQLPNFAFSVAVAYFHLDEDPESEKRLVANNLLQKALIMFPGVLIPLLDKCSVQPDSRVSSHPFFTMKGVMSQSPALSQLIQLYVCRNYHIWKECVMLDWLERNVHVVLDRFDKCDAFVVECEEKRKRNYQKAPRNVLRHIVLSDTKEAMEVLAEDYEGVLIYDPLPPPDSVDLYVRSEQPRVNEEYTAISVFVRSFLPSFRINRPVPAVDVQIMNNADGGGEAEGAVAAQGSTSALDAMRALRLSSQHDVPNAANVEEDSEEDV